jgi:7-cyano-7-deazaguanine synthase
VEGAKIAAAYNRGRESQIMRSVVLLSSGLDSTVNLYEAQARGSVLLALTFDYGQRARAKEIASARKISHSLGIPHKVVDLSFFKDLGGSSLVDTNLTLPTDADVEIDNLEMSQQSAKSVWVPNRNGIFLNIAAGFAESLGAEVVVPGFNLEEAQTFPDNTQGFLDQLTQSFFFSTSNKVKAKCFTTSLNKTEIVKRGMELKVDFKNIWPCYQAFEKWCGVCESCKRSKRAFEANGLKVF